MPYLDGAGHDALASMLPCVRAAESLASGTDHYAVSRIASTAPVPVGIAARKRKLV